jgi:hypothetical protein
MRAGNVRLRRKLVKSSLKKHLEKQFHLQIASDVLMFAT